LKCISGGFDLQKKHKRLPRNSLIIYSSSWGNHLYFFRRCFTLCNFKEPSFFYTSTEIQNCLHLERQGTTWAATIGNSTTHQQQNNYEIFYNKNEKNTLLLQQFFDGWHPVKSGCFFVGRA
jgi:hypothetical protein